jgi:TetR/AcrR family transcriptional repressor of nem operon
MSRPKAFDRETALEGAIPVFADLGYDGTSTEVLLKAMGISRQSMYDTFGDKRRLYLEALQHYAAGHVAEHLRALNGASSPLRGIEAMFEAMVLKSTRQGEPGCLGIGAVCEFGRSDDEVSLLTDTAGRTLQAALEHRIAEAHAAGETDSALDVRTAAQFIAATLSALKISARGGASADALRGVARMAIRSLR